jgi:hypothetical protein
MHNLLNRVTFSAAVATFLVLSAAGSNIEGPKPVGAPEQTTVVFAGSQIDMITPAPPSKPAPDSKPKCPPPLKCQ